MKKHALVGLSSLGLVSSLYVTPALAESDEITELKDRLNELESLVLDLEDKTGGGAVVNAFDAINLDIGGYYHGSAFQADFTNQAGDDGGNIQGFTRNLLYLRMEADINENWSLSFGNLFGQVHNEQPELADLGVDSNFDTIPDFLDNFNFTPPASFTADPTNTQFNQLLANELDSAYTIFGLNFPVDINISYKHSDSFNVTIGRQRAPIGYHSQQIYPMAWRLAELPRFLLGHNGVTAIFTPFIQGVALEGKFFPNDGDFIVSYSAFHSDINSAADLTNGFLTNEQFGGRISFGLADQSLDIGLNYVGGQRETPGGDSAFYGGNRYDAVGLDVYINNQFLEFVGEFYESNEAADVNGAYSLQPSFHVNSWLDIYVAREFVDAPLYQTTNPAIASFRALGLGPVIDASGVSETVFAPSHLGEVTENTIGVYIKAAEDVRLRAGYTLRRYHDLGDAEVEMPFISATAGF